MNERIYLSPPDVTQLEEDAIVRAFRSGWIAPLGPEVNAFEEELAEYCDRKHAVALSSGTAALHLGLITLGVGPGDLHRLDQLSSSDLVEKKKKAGTAQ